MISQSYTPAPRRISGDLYADGRSCSINIAVLQSNLGLQILSKIWHCKAFLERSWNRVLIDQKVLDINLADELDNKVQ